MNFQAFTNDSLTMMHHGVRGALAVDDTLSELGKECRFRVRETPEWKMYAADLEAEMLKRGMVFEVIDWSEDLFSFRRPQCRSFDESYSGSEALIEEKAFSGEAVKEHQILGTDEQDAERQRNIWLAENPAIKVLRVHRPRREPHNLLTRLGGRNVPRFSITVEYEEADVTKE